MASTKPEDRNQITRHVIATAPASPSSSPSHEFSFTINSLHNHSSILLPLEKSKAVNGQIQPSPTSSSSLAIVDLTPADDIFFHGHLLPLHHLSRLPTPLPRLSADSLDSFTLPITDFFEEAKPSNNTVDETENQNQKQKQKQKQNQNQNQSRSQSNSFNIKNTESRGKSKSFSMLGLKRWRSKGALDEPAEKPKRKLRISDVSQFISRMVKPLMFFKGTKMMMSTKEDLHGNGAPRGQYYSKSLSGNLASRRSVDRSRDLRGRSGEFSAPASMRISPSNSGLLAAKAGMSPPASDSTMEELQAAIQAAIAHCKNSINCS